MRPDFPAATGASTSARLILLVAYSVVLLPMKPGRKRKTISVALHSQTSSAW